MEIKTIAQYVTIFLSSATGATIIGFIIKAIAIAVASVKEKKHSKLTEADKNDIANKVKTDLFNSLQGSLTLDADAIVDKATNARLSALEQSHNELVKAINQATAYTRATMNAVGDFKTVSTDSKEAIKKLLKEDAVEVKEVADTKLAEIKIESKVAEAKQEVSKVSY